MADQPQDQLSDILPNQDQDSNADQAGSAKEQPSVNTANYLPASQEFLAEMEARKAQSAPTPASVIEDHSDSSAPDTMPPANEVNFNLPPIGEPVPQPQTQAPLSSLGGNSFRPPQDVIDNLTEDQKKFINSASWGPIFGLYFAIAQNSLKWSLLLIFTPMLFGILAGLSGLALMLMLNMKIDPIVSQSLYPLGGLINIILIIVLMFKGRKIAWESHYWDSFESYKRNMSRWSKWAKIYALILLLLIVGFIILVVWIGTGFGTSQSPLGNSNGNQNSTTTRINEANDSGRKNYVMQVVTASEKCYTDKATNNYASCNTLTKLASGDYLKLSSNPGQVFIETSSDNSNIIIYTELQASTATCNQGTGSPKYFTYSSSTATTQTVCGAKPKLSQANPTPTISATPKANVTPIASATPSPTSQFTR